MPVGSIANNGVQGFQRAREQAADAAARIARASVTEETQDTEANGQVAGAPNQAQPAPREDLVQPLVELREAELNARANARSIEAENRTLGSLLDIRA
ncbi:MAG: hypothetical protein HYV16_08315 [Gammaproteobacteria bacterium]|nr:hypothetical protein [Gammaproteobacteria bacterium]